MPPSYEPLLFRTVASSDLPLARQANARLCVGAWAWRLGLQDKASLRSRRAMPAK